MGSITALPRPHTAPQDFKSKAISLVLTGGVVAAFVGPYLAKSGQNLVTAEFMGSYLFLIGLMVLTALVLIFLDIPNLTPSERAAAQRPLSRIMMQPVFIAATLAATMGQGVMNLLMTAIPIAMLEADFQFTDTAFVISWHSFGMFGPGFVTGSLIKRFGEVRIILTGVVLQIVCIGVALSGEGVMEFWLAMLLLGVGWNFAFTGGTSLLTTAHNPAERAKTQGAMSVIKLRLRGRGVAVIRGAVALLRLGEGEPEQHPAAGGCGRGDRMVRALQAAGRGCTSLGHQVTGAWCERFRDRYRAVYCSVV